MASSSSSRPPPLPVSKRNFKSIAPVIEDPGTPEASKSIGGDSCCSDSWEGIANILMPRSRRSLAKRLSHHSYVRRGNRQMIPERVDEDIKRVYIVDDHVLASGAFGVVKRAIRRSSKKERVVKSMMKTQIDDPEALHNEILIMSDLDHPHICRLYDTFETADDLHLVMEFCKGGDLSDAICEAERFMEDDARHYMLHVLQAVNYMHNRAIAHRDLKPENFLLSLSKSTPFKENHLKLVDFGFAQTFKPGEKTMKTKCGTPHYLAPEVFLEDCYDEKCDMWSCGIILYVFLCGEPPFDGENLEDIVSCAKAGKPSFVAEVWSDISPVAKLAIMQTCNIDVGKRFSASQALESPWILKGDELMKSMTSNAIADRLRKFKQSSALKKAGAHLIAHCLNDSDLNAMRQTFMAMDKNGDGMLSLDEVKGAMADMPNLSDVEALFRQADTDGSGQLEYTEFLTALASSSQLSCKQACWEAFSVFDKDGDGRISLAELQEFFGREGKGVSVEEVKSVDSNGDGLIDFEEFRAIMQSGLASPEHEGVRWQASPDSKCMFNRRGIISSGLRFNI